MTPRTTFGGLVLAARRDPGDLTIQAAIIDCIQENGRSIEQAQKIVARVCRDPLARLRCREIQAIVDAGTVAGRRLRAAIRRGAECGPHRVPITVVLGGSPPRVSGEPPRYTFRDGGECRNPGAARRAGLRVEYHRSTLRIDVGCEWVLRRMERRP